MPALAANSTNKRSVLISGASIAGTTLAYWLDRYGFDVTVVEKAPTIRLGGYPIDVRGNAIEVAERMGLADALEAANIHSRRLSFVDGNGENAVSVIPEVLTGGRVGRDVELARGALTDMIHALTRDRLTYRYNTSITALTEDEAGIDVAFSDGTAGRYDLVIGADGLHSNVRGLAFGPESQFDRAIGRCVAVFEVKNTFGFSREGIASNKPGRLVVLFAAGDSDVLHVGFNFPHGPLTRAQGSDLAFQRRLLNETFADWGWIVPDLLRALNETKDLYFDEVKQIRMPAYARGRVALVGDAAYAPSFLTGQGSSMAMVGAYVLAGELARHADHRLAGEAYDRVIRPYVEANQARLEEGGSALFPDTQEAIDARNAYLAALTEAPAAEGRPEHSMLDLSAYSSIAKV